MERNKTQGQGSTDTKQSVQVGSRTKKNREFLDQAVRRSLLKVILMPHSHNDPGWVKTLDTYYQGQTKKILNVIVDNLHGHPKRKFVWAETIFLNMWFNDPNVDDARKQKFRDLLKNKAWFQN